MEHINSQLHLQTGVHVTGPSLDRRTYLNFLGIEVTAIVKEDLLLQAKDWLPTTGLKLVVGHNLHSAYLYNSDSIFRNVYDSADLILADGKPIELAVNRALSQQKSHRKCERLGTTDWLTDWMGSLEPEQIAVVGGSLASNEGFIRRMNQKFGKHEFYGIPGEGWSTDLADNVVCQLTAIQPTIVIIGLGMPLQEHFYWVSRTKLPNALYLLVGGAIDQLSGAQSLAPRSLGNLGLEWLWRLFRSPKRLWKRYLIEPWRLLFLRMKIMINDKVGS